MFSQVFDGEVEILFHQVGPINPGESAPLHPEYHAPHAAAEIERCAHTPISRVVFQEIVFVWVFFVCLPVPDATGLGLFQRACCMCVAFPLHVAVAVKIGTSARRFRQVLLDALVDALDDWDSPCERLFSFGHV